MRPPPTNIAGSWVTLLRDNWPPEISSASQSGTGDSTWRRTNLGHLLFVATGICIRDKLVAAHSAGFSSVTDAQLSLFQHLGDEGDRLTALAARAGLTKQSMIELVDKAERQKLITRDADPADRRAKIVRFTSSGFQLRNAAERGAKAAERRFSKIVGRAALIMTKRDLITYAGTSSNGIEQVMAEAARRFICEVLGRARRRGHVAITEPLLALFRHLELEGSRLTEISVAARVTKQSMRALVERAEALGLVERTPDPADGRAKIIRFSTPGLAMLADMRRGIAEAENSFTESTRARSLATVKAALTKFISVPDEI